MSKKLIATVGMVVGLSTCLTAVAFAGIPFAPFSTCQVSIVQSPVRSQCINNFTPDVVRLCPSTATQLFDTVTFNLTILDALGAPVTNASVSAYETAGIVNIATGGSTTASTNALGKASITVSQGSGYGRVGVCVAGVLICEVEVRSPDVAAGGLPGQCAVLPTGGTSFVNASDFTNTSCGFGAKFGPVTVGTNNAWDLDCSNSVNANDVLGTLGKGGMNQHFGHGAPLGAKTTCP